MNNEIIISNVNPQDIIIGEGGAAGITDVLVNDVSVVENNIAYVVVPTKLSELQNNMHFITQETDPTVPYVVKQITSADINRWNSKQDQLLSGINIKTINNNSILGEGNINVDKTYTAGTGINITSENVINNTITSYNDLNDLPTIPTKISDLQNDSDFVESSELSNVAFSGSYLDLSNTPDLSLYATLDTNELLNYYTKDFFFKILPKVSGSGTSVTLNNTIDNVQMYLTLGASELTQDGTPTPSSPQDIHIISGSNTIVISKKNLFDGSRTVNSTFTASVPTALQHFKDTGEYATGYCNSSNVITAYAGTYETCFVQVAPNTKYRLSSQGAENNGFSCIICLDDNGNSLQASSNWQGANYTIDTPTGTKYLMFSPRNANVMYVQLEYGETTTTFESYVSQEADIDLGDIEYCKIGTYADRIFRNVEGDPDYDSERTGTWYIKKNIGKVVLDGTESSSLWGLDTSSGFYRETITINGINGYDDSSRHTGRFICDRFNSNTENGIGNVLQFKSTLVFYVPSNITTTAQWQTWLSTHNTEVYYILATPTYTPITGTLASQLENVYQKLLSYDEQTNISQVNNDLPFIISATTFKNMSNL